jgi:pSer/pThr/pTyr-binding forkhead associated (FHA) protein
VPKTIPLNGLECFVGRFPEPGDTKFTHKTQTKIECPFVSSTHFAIACNGKAKGTRPFTLSDHSRNGTFVNGTLVGMGKSVEIQDGAEITLMYKNKVRIAYSFALMDHSGDKKAPTLSPVGIKSEVLAGEDLGRVASLKSQAESVADNLTKQIAVLQEEGKQLELRIQQQTARAESATLELERANAKVAAQEKLLQQRQDEKADLTERLATAESHAAAIEARSCKLSEQLEETKAELKEVRVRNASLTEDLNTKNAQLVARNSLMQNSNMTMANEKSKWTKLEAKHEAACAALQQAKEKIERVVTANQALQDLLSDKDADLLKLRGQNDKLIEMVATGRGAVERREAEVRGLLGMFSKAVAELAGIDKQSAALTKESNYFEEIASAAAELKWVGSQMPGNQETYIELFSAADMPGTAVNGGAGTGASSPASSESERGSLSSDEGDGEQDDAEAVAGSKRKRSQTSAEEDGKNSKLQLTATEPQVAAANAQNVDGEQACVDEREDAMEEEDDDADMQRTQAPATFAHLFEDISQRSRADSDVSMEAVGPVAMVPDSQGAAEVVKSSPTPATVAAVSVSPSATVQQKIQAIRERAASTPATPAAATPVHQRASSSAQAVSSLGASGSASAHRASLEVDLRSEDGQQALDHSAAPEEDKRASPGSAPAAAPSPAGNGLPNSKSGSQQHEVIEL